MNLRDLKPGDRGLIEFQVVAEPDTDGDIMLLVGDRGFTTWASGDVEVTKLPPRARPVRKGDEIEGYGSVFAYLCRTGEYLYTTHPGDPTDMGYDDIKSLGAYTHPDGAPIDWEASE